MAVNVAALEATLGLNNMGFIRGLAHSENRISRFSNAASRTSRTVAYGMGAVAAAVGGVALHAVKTGAAFDKQMSKVQALSGATGKEFISLRKLAIDLGAKTVFSASESAEAMTVLGAAGFDTKKIFAALPGIMDAAAASGADFATTTDIMVSVMGSFNLKAREMGRISDVLAKAANLSNASMEDLGGSLKYVAPVAKSAGVSLEETAAAIAILANRGVKGFMAGTSLRMSLIRLADPPKEAARAMDKLGFSVTDSHKKFKPLGTIIGELRSKTAGMTQAQKLSTVSMIFGAEAATTMLTLIEAGPKVFADFTKSLKDSGGESARMAKIMNDNVAGAWEEFKGAVESAEIRLSDFLNRSVGVKRLLKGAADAVDKFSKRFAEVADLIDKKGLRKGLNEAFGPNTARNINIIAGAIVGSLVPAFYALSRATIVASGPLVPFVLAGMAIGLAANYIYENWNKVSPVLKRVGDALAPLGPWFDDFATRISPMLNEALAALGDLWDDLSKDLKDAMPYIEKAFFMLKEGGKFLQDSVIPALEDFAAVVRQNWPEIKQIIQAFGLAFIGSMIIMIGVTGEFLFVLGAFVRVASKTFRIVSTGVRMMGVVWKSTMTFIGQVVAAVGKFIEGTMRGAYKIMRGDLKGGLADMKNAALGFKSDMKSAGNQLAASMIAGARNGGAPAYGVGSNMGAGLVLGIKAWIGKSASAGAALGAAALNAARREVKEGSPAKKFIELGRNIVLGLMQGLNFPAFVDKMTGTARQIISIFKQIASATRRAFRGVKSRKDDAILSILLRTQPKLLALARQREAVAKKLAAAQAKLKSLMQVKAEFSASFRESLLSFAGITNFEGHINARNVADFLKKRLDAIRKFAADISALARRGLSKDILGQIAAAGVEGGGGFASALTSATAEQIAEINALQSQIGSAAGGVSSQIAGHLYDAGIKAAKGLVNGLISQQSRIEKAMLRIALAMKKAIKSALGIHSPSRVMMGIGENLIKGLQLGIDKSAVNMRGLAARAASAATPATAPAMAGGMTFTGPIYVNVPDGKLSTFEREVRAAGLRRRLNG